MIGRDLDLRNALRRYTLNAAQDAVTGLIYALANADQVLELELPIRGPD